MNPLPIIKIGDHLLKQRASPITDFGSNELSQLIDQLFSHMRHYNGVGIAAPQIGISKHIFVYGFEKNSRYPDQQPVPENALLNTEILFYSEETIEIYEGCLSVPNIRGLVPRFSTIKYRANTPTGEVIEKTASGFEARIIQHEVDHLEGKVFPMRMKDISTLLYSPPPPPAHA